MVPSPAPRARAIVLAADRVEDVAAVKRAVERAVAARPGWSGRVRVEVYGPERLKQVAQGILIFKMLMGAFTAISLLVGGIGITNVLLASLLERTREIGIRKAVGARRRDLVLQFLAESMAIALAGALVGAVLGIVGAMGVTALILAKTDAPMFAALTWQTVSVSAGAAMVVGILAGLYPALRASRLTPMDAIQRE
jgi:putative ABC transport system permease protein